jgi:SnoaL-like polyketide cyclase
MLQTVTSPRAFLAYFENPEVDQLDEILTPDCAFHIIGPLGEGLPSGPAGARALNAAVRRFAWSHWRIEEEIVAGDRVVLRTVNEAVHHGEWNGLAGNGRVIPFDVVWIFRLEGDRIADVYRVAADLARLRPLGGKIVPA